VNPQLSPRQIERLMLDNATAIGGGILIPDAWQTVVAAKKAAPGAAAGPLGVSGTGVAIGAADDTAVPQSIRRVRRRMDRDKT